MSRRVDERTDRALVYFREGDIFGLTGLLMGEKIGSGAYRDVYDCPLDRTLVIKHEHSSAGRFCNVDEWNLDWSPGVFNQMYIEPCVDCAQLTPIAPGFAVSLK